MCCRFRQTNGQVNRLMGVKSGEGRGGKRWGKWVEGSTDAVVLGETQLLGFHLETQALYNDENVSVLFTHTHISPILPPPPSLHESFSHQHFPPLSSNIHNNRLLHPPTLSHPLPSSPALQAPNLASHLTVA